MSQAVATSKVSNNFLTPAWFPDDMRCLSDPPKPNTIIAKGTVIGLVTSASAAEVQTLTASGTPASGTWQFQIQPVGGAIVQCPLAIAWNASLATIQVQADAVFGAGNTVVSGSWGAGIVFTFAGSLATGDMPAITIINSALLTSVPAAITITVTETTKGVKKGVFAAYASGNTDGTQVAVGAAETDICTDIYGNITYGLQSGGGNGPGLTARYAVRGFFNIADLVGLDATAITALGRVVAGTSTSGVLSIR